MRIDGRFCFVFALAAGVLAASVFAQTVGPVPVSTGGQESSLSGAAPSGGGTLSWAWIMRSGGWVMYALAFMSVVALALVIYFMIVLRPEQVVPARLQREVLNSLRTGALEDARKACEARPSPFSAVTAAAIRHVVEVPNTDSALLKDVIESEGARQASTIQGQVQYLFDIAVLSPMVGLLGTVFGMIHAFQSVALDAAKAKPILLAAGVSEALVATAGGLMVGIPTMAFFACFRGRANHMIGLIEAAASDLLALLQQRKRA